MTNLFNALYTLMHRRPVRVLGIAALCLLLLLPGIPFVNLATGIDTLIKPSTSVYKDNIELENSFGGESIVLMYTSDNAKETLTAANLQQFNAIETALQHTPGVYSVITPSTVVKQMTKKQSEKMQEGVANMSSGLLEMSDKLRQMADGTAGQKTSLGASAGSSNGKNSAEALGTLAQGQEQMSASLGQMQTGLTAMSDGYQNITAQLKALAQNLTGLAAKLDGSAPPTPAQLETMLSQLQEQLQQLIKENPELAANPQIVQISNQLQALQGQLNTPAGAMDLSQLQAALNQSGTGLMQIAEKMDTLNMNLAEIAGKMSKLEQGASNTATALGKMQTEFGTLQAKQTALPAQLSKQEEGLSNLSDKLKELGSGLDTISQHASNLEPGVPKTQENLDELLYDNGKLRDMFKNVIVDDQHILSIVRLEGNLEDETKEAAIARVEQLVQEHPVEGASVMVSGKSVLNTALRAEMKKSMQKMVLLAVSTMVLVLAFVFRVRWRILALPVILAAVLGTMGIMGYSRVPMTMVSMAVFPILIGLGVDYAIQFHNRYQEEIERGCVNEI